MTQKLLTKTEFQLLLAKFNLPLNEPDLTVALAVAQQLRAQIATLDLYLSKQPHIS